jgi:hypothetical protein
MAVRSIGLVGWRRDTVNVGDMITVEGWLARDGSNLLNMGSATMGGRKILGAPAQQGDNNE